MASRRILLINHEYPPLGGSGGNATRHIAKALARLGHKPYVLTAASGGLPRQEEHDGVMIHRLPLWRRRTVGEDGHRQAVVDGTAFFLAALRAAPRLARAWKPDLTLAFFTLPGGLLGWWLKYRLGIPYVIALQGAHMPPNDGGERNALQRLKDAGMRFLWRQAGAIVAPADHVAADARHFDPRTPVSVIPSGADVHGIIPKENYAADGPVKLLYVGRLAKRKGLDVLLEALAKLSSALRWKLIIAGDGPEWPMVAGDAARMAMLDRVEMQGWQGWSELPKMYRDADVFVLPSYDGGMPAALLEAMATGLPVIGTNVSAMGEAVLHETTGLLVPPRDSDALADALTLMISDPTRWQDMGRAGRTRVESYYSWVVATGKWLAVINEVLKKGPLR